MNLLVNGVAERDPDDFATRLSILVDAGFSARTLAEMAEVSHGTVQAVINGRSKNPGTIMLTRIANATGYNVQWLVEGKGPRQGQATTTLLYRYDALRAVVEHLDNRDRWTPAAVAAVAAHGHDLDEDPGEAHWTSELDKADSALRIVLSKQTGRGGDPTSDLDDPPRSGPSKKR